MSNKAYYHLPGLYEFYELYKRLLPLYKNHREYFYDFIEIGSIYGSANNTIFSGGRIEYSLTSDTEVLALMNEYNIPIRLTFSNLVLKEEYLNDLRCNELLRKFEDDRNGIIISSDLLLNYIKDKYPKYHFISSTTKVLTNKNDLIKELDRDDFKYVVPDFRLNKKLDDLSISQKEKVELLCNECCPTCCLERFNCYKNVSMQVLDDKVADHICPYSNLKEGYRFSVAQKSSSFISINDIKDKYLPSGFTNFKIEGRTLGSAIVFEILLYYMVKPEYQLIVREEVYLDNMLDLF